MDIGTLADMHSYSRNSASRTPSVGCAVLGEHGVTCG